MMRLAALPRLLIAVFLLSQESGARGDDVRSELAATTSNARKRFDWFYQKRAFPGDTIAQGYLLRGLEQIGGYGADRRVGLVWESIGPQPGTYFGYGNIGGRIPALAVHPTDPSVVYIGPADGGVWKTTNGGISWEAKTDFLASLASGSLAIDPNSPETVYWGTGEPYYSGDAYGGAGVFQSTDGGASWTSIGLTGEKRIPEIIVDPNNGNTLFAATWGGIYRTTNRGGTWTKTLNQGYGYEVVIHPTNSSILYCGIGDNSGNAGIYKSTDNGVSWTKLTNGLPASGTINRMKIDIARSSPSTVYALMSSRSPFGALLGAFKSVDDGGTWTQLTAAPANLLGNQGWYDIQLGVHPENPDMVFMGGLHVYRTTNGGTSWTNVSGSSVHVDQHAIGFGTGVVYIGNDGGMWKSTNNGGAWTNLNATLAVTQFYSVGTDKLTPARIYGGTQDNGTQRTTGGQAWTGVIGGDGGMIVVDHANSNIVYGETQNGNIYKSVNGGTSFSFLYGAAGAWVTPLRLDPSNSSVVFTANERVMRSTNGGSSWTAISDSLNGASQIQWLTIHPAVPGEIYAASGNKVFRTTNGGGSWATISAGLPVRTVEQIVVDPDLPSAVYVVLSGTGSGHVYRSTNSGSTWTNISGDLPDVPASAVLLHPGLSTTIYLGTDLGLFMTTNGGTSWIKETGLPNVAVINLALTSDSYLVAATHGRSMFRTLLAPNPSIVTTAPAPGSVWNIGAVVPLAWDTEYLTGTVRIELSRDGGASFPEVLHAGTANDGTETWTASGAPTSAARIRVSSVLNPSVADTTPGTFTISAYDFLTFVVLEDNGPVADTLWFGTAPGATEGIDGAFGETELPPRPPAGVFDIRWSVPASEGSYRDVRPPLSRDQASVVFTALFQEGSGGYPFRVRWNPSELQDGRFVIRDQVTGGSLFEVDMKLTDSLIIGNPAIGTFEIVQTGSDTVSVSTIAGWNMISLPVTVADPQVATLFPSAASGAFAFTEQGYAAQDSMKYGKGYWMKFGLAGTDMVGGVRTVDTVDVQRGWNLIGSVSFPAPVDSIVQIPAAIVLSQFIGQSGPAATIEPGRSYWVKTDAAGKLILRAAPAMHRTMQQR